MAVVEDVLATRLDLLGEGQYTTGLGRAAGALQAFGITGATGAAGLAFFGRAALAAGEDVAIFGRAAANFKGTFPADDIAAFTGELEGLTGIADDSIAGFLGLLGTFQLTGAAARRLAEPILNAAEALKAQGVSTEQLAVQIGKAAQTGDASSLRRVGIIIDDVGFKSLDTAGRVEALAKALNSQGGATAARDALNTLPGAIAGATTAVGSLTEALGAPLIGPLKMTADLVRGAANAFTGLPTPVQTCITLIGVGLAGAMAVYSAQTAFAVMQTVRLTTAQLANANSAGKMAAANTAAGNAVAAGGKGISGKARVVAAAATVAADVGLGFIPDDAFGKGDGIGRVARNVGLGVANGAGVGYQFGGVPGAIGGGLLGGIGAAGAETWRTTSEFFGGGKSPEKTEAEKQTELLAKIAGNTDPSKSPLSSSVMPVARQIGAEMALANTLA
jgi:hypothetical protein